MDALSEEEWDKVGEQFELEEMTEALIDSVVLGGELQGQPTPTPQSTAHIQREPGGRRVLDDLVDSGNWTSRVHHGK